MRPNLFIPFFTLLVFASSDVRAGPVTMFTDIDEWRVAASAVGTGMVHEIDFETLPDGSPSVAFTPITADFNYTEQGVSFSSPFPDLFIGGDPGFFALGSQNPDTGARNWLTGHFIPNALAVGIFFPGGTTLSVFDENVSEIATITGGRFGEGQFLGIVSDVPIAWMTQDRGSSGESLESFLFTPVPEPGTLFLLGAGGLLLLRRRRRCISPGSRRFLLVVALLVPTGVYGQPGGTYTTTTDFNTGFLNNADGVADQSDGELAIRTSPQTLPYIWVACTKRYTVVRIATSTFDPLTQQAVLPGQVLGEYWAAPEGCRDGLGYYHTDPTGRTGHPSVRGTRDC